jgi:hypothetical protein
MDPNEGLSWENLDKHLLRKLQMPQNAAFLNGRKPEDVTVEETVKILKAFVGFPKSQTLTGPMTLLRGTSDANPAPLKRQNNPFGGWWFPEEFLLKLHEQFGRIPMPELLHRSGVRGNLRSSLALTLNWNEFEELWCLQLNQGERLTALVGATSEQFLDSELEGLGRLVGGAQQFYFPVIPPWSVKPYPYRLV